MINLGGEGKMNEVLYRNSWTHNQEMRINSSQEVSWVPGAYKINKGNNKRWDKRRW